MSQAKRPGSMGAVNEQWDVGVRRSGAASMQRKRRESLMHSTQGQSTHFREKSLASHAAS